MKQKAVTLQKLTVPLFLQKSSSHKTTVDVHTPQPSHTSRPSKAVISCPV